MEKQRVNKIIEMFEELGWTLRWDEGRYCLQSSKNECGEYFYCCPGEWMYIKQKSLDYGYSSIPIVNKEIKDWAQEKLEEKESEKDYIKISDLCESIRKNNRKE